MPKETIYLEELLVNSSKPVDSVKINKNGEFSLKGNYHAHLLSSETFGIEIYHIAAGLAGTGGGGSRCCKF